MIRPLVVLSLTLISGCVAPTSQMPAQDKLEMFKGGTRNEFEAQLPASCRRRHVSVTGGVTASASHLRQLDEYVFADGGVLQVTYRPAFVAELDELVLGKRSYSENPKDVVIEVPSWRAGTKKR
jgi:hypothetical protein